MCVIHPLEAWMPKHPDPSHARLKLQLNKKLSLASVEITLTGLRLGALVEGTTRKQQMNNKTIGTKIRGSGGGNNTRTTHEQQNHWNQD